ncbi:MAG: R3H domain-containing nucleic acid-binding protein, partial [Elusimicrobiota bacterium]
NFQDPTDGSLLIGRGGRSLFSLEIILQSIINHEFRGKIESPPFPRIMADVNQYRMRQEEKIKNTIARTMELVRKTGKPQQLEPMPARMRRMVHIYLKENPEFETHSEGIGDMRRVVIKLRSSVESRGK